MKESTKALSWNELSKLSSLESNRIEGPNNPYALIRLFGQSAKDVRVTLYRDHHAWCPYCQKVWLWLEWKRIPYQIRKVTMRCYGRKEDWYLKKVPSGMLPAIEIDQRLITESDQIILALEKAFGYLGKPLEHPDCIHLRNLERKLFRAWCIWLCSPVRGNNEETKRREQFHFIAKELEGHLHKDKSFLLDPTKHSSGIIFPGSADVIFIPYLERMNASLTYYKGVCIREDYLLIDKWFRTLEQDSIYRGTQSDFHTHAHDLPPQMGGCWLTPNSRQKKLAHLIDIGEGLGDLESSFKTSTKYDAEKTALERVIKHREKIMLVNPLDSDSFDQPLRAALTLMISGKTCIPLKNSAAGLRYLKDRISVPRDMPLLSARKLRQALEYTASLDGVEQGLSIPFNNRFDQNPDPFLKQSISN